MGFLSPWFLLGFGALAAPLYLHLLRRQTTTPQRFSSLMFFEPRTQASMRHRRLRYLWLLSLRLALLALLVAVFADPFLLRPAAGLASNRLTAIVVDHSFSMKAGTRLADARRQALATLAGVHGRAQVMALGSRLEILTQPTTDMAALRAAIAGIEPGDSHADFGELARGMRAVAEATPTPIELDFFSDLQQSSLPATFADLALPANVTLVPHAVAPTAPPNWTIESVKAPTQLWGSPKETKPARVEAVVAGYGTPAATRSISLLINGQKVASQAVQVPASGRATAVFDAVVVPYGWSQCAVELDPADGFAADDRSLFTVRRADPERVLFVHSAGDTRSLLYFTAALGSGPDAAFTVESASAGAVADRQPSHYALVVLSDVPSLPPGFDAALARYVQGGGGVLIAAGVATRQMPFFNLLGTHNYASNPSSTLLPGWEGVRFFYAAQVAPGDARVVAALSDQTPLLLDKKVGEGRVELFASGFDNLTNDFPLHPSFVPFIRQAASELAGDADNAGGARAVDSFLTLRTAKEKGIGVQVSDPRGRHPLSLDQATTAQSLPLTQAGFYQLKLANGREQVVAVNPDRRESDLAAIPPETLALWRGVPVSKRSQTPAGPPPVRVPVSLWWYVMLLLLLAAVIESVVASRYLAVRRDETAEREGLLGGDLEMPRAERASPDGNRSRVSERPTGATQEKSGPATQEVP